MRPVIRLLAFALALFAAGPALAYTIVLKDGSQILAKQDYVVKGDKVIITLPSGTETAIAISEIDVPRTKEMNVQDLGTAILIEGGKVQGLPPGQAPTPRPRELSDLIRSGTASMQGQEPTATAADVAGAAGPARRPPGFSERVIGSTRTPLRDTDLAGSIRSYVGERGLPVEVWQGSSARRPLLVYETESEGNVFRALLASSAALIEAQKRFPGAVDAIEMICETSDGSLGARFTLGPQQAADLLSSRLEITRFFIENVQF